VDETGSFELMALSEPTFYPWGGPRRKKAGGSLTEYSSCRSDICSMWKGTCFPPAYCHLVMLECNIPGEMEFFSVLFLTTLVCADLYCKNSSNISFRASKRLQADGLRTEDMHDCRIGGTDRF